MNTKLNTSVLTCIIGMAFILMGRAQVTFHTDLTDAKNAKQTVAYQLNVFNRITPIHGVNKVPNSNGHAKLCIVRPLGGIAKNGVADLSKDSYKWDEKTKSFYTDFRLLKKQIDGVIDAGLKIHQIVLDNPSWAFQRDAQGKLAGDSLKVATYGNAEPPQDYKAWRNYLKAVIQFLTHTYGTDKIAPIQFDIGREIGTATHWSGTQLEFFDFYKASVEAIHSVLPQAKVGTHFLWGTSKNAWGTDFVKWAKAHQVHYDFIGVSYYPFYQQAKRTNFTEVYAKDFGVIKDIPEWNKNAKLEMHEFALIKSLNKAGNAFEKAPNAHQNAFMLGLMKMFYQHQIHHVFQWGDGTAYLPTSTELLKIEGNRYYENTKQGKPQSDKNYVGAIFSKDERDNQLHILAYNYNSNPESQISENLCFKSDINAAPGTVLKYRVAIYNKTNNKMDWSNWKKTKTQGDSSQHHSTIILENKLPPFSILSYHIVLSNKI